MTSLKKLSLGDILYKYLTFNGIGKYEVIGIREYSKGQVQYELLCHACTHGYKCEVLVTATTKGRFEYVSMIKGEDQEYWHDDSPYFLTQNEAIIYQSNKILSKKSKEINNLEKKLEDAKKSYSEVETYINTIKTVIK